MNKIKGIYKLTSPSGKSYIGQSTDLDKRLNQYKNLDCKGQIYLYKALLKYEWNNFEVEILWSIDCDFPYIKTLLNKLEIEYIKQYNSYNSGYNLTKGGEGGLLGYKHTEEARKKMSEAQKGKKHLEETKLKMSKSNKSKNPVLQYDLSGVFIKRWDSTKEAQMVTGIDRCSIAKCCNGKYKTAGGFIWERPDNNYEVWK